VALDSNSFINLDRVSALALEQSAYSQKILNQVLRGFGVRELHNANDLAMAKDVAGRQTLNLVIIDPGFDEGKGMEFLHWLRRMQGHPNRFAPVILMLGHTTQASVAMARDAGANSVLAKPYAPRTLLDRLVSVSKDKRPYVEASTFVGPDRRFKNEPLPEGVRGRRVGDDAALVGDGKAA
jgi:DNA-binding response OmpR family regulator